MTKTQKFIPIAFIIQYKMLWKFESKCKNKKLKKFLLAIISTLKKPTIPIKFFLILLTLNVRLNFATKFNENFILTSRKAVLTDPFLPSSQLIGFTYICMSVALCLQLNIRASYNLNIQHF